MKRISIYLFLIVSLLCFNGALLAQYEISLPYECGFEDVEEMENWVLNAGEEGLLCADQWMIGNLDASVGHNSLYISCDTGQSIIYGASPNYVMAYRPIVVPKGDLNSEDRCSVNISFDWKGGGNDSSLLNCYLLPFDFVEDEDKDSLFSNSDRAILPVELNKPTMRLYGSEDWTSVSIVDSIEYGRTYYLAFIWQNNNTDVSLSDLSVCFDNIQIAEAMCPTPENLQVESTCDSLTVIWEGGNEMYEFEYRPSDMKRWLSLPVMQADLNKNNKMVLDWFAEGLYEFRVRGVCGESKSAWFTATNVVVYCPDRHCFDYLNLDREGVTCLVGSAVESTSESLTLSSTKPVDLGSKDKRSRHTVNWKQNEFDPRTGNQLRTIPEGSLASVRLGNWEAGSEAEGIEYDYFVDTMSADILLVKYAVVLESPGHGLMADPYFRIEILDEAGNVIDSQCGVFDLTPTNSSIEWNRYNDFVWRDWISIGLDLSRYHGQMVKIRFTTRDCTLDAHAGYAYFTLDCMDSKINVEGCGDFYEFEAPDGFRYAWTGEDRDKVISTEKILRVPANDTATYYCMVEFIDRDGCGFELSASVEPCFPHADFEWEWIPSNCEENKIALINKSCVYTRIEGKDVATDEPCETLYWSISNYNNDGENDRKFLGEGERVEVTLPKEGGMFEVWVSAGISGNACIDDTVSVINIPRLGEYRDTIYDTICERDYTYDFTSMPESGIYVDTLVSVAGCDSIIVLDLTVLPTVDVDTMITIKEGEELEFAGEIYTEAGIYHIDRVLDTVCQNITLCLIVETALDDVNAMDLVIVPNPIGSDENAVVKYEWSAEEQDGLMVEIINSLGQRVDVFEPKTYPIVLPRVGDAGVYYVRITTGVGSVYVGKLIVEDR